MNWNRFVRQSHRWLAIAFTLGVAVDFVVLARAQSEPPFWVYLMPLLPLALLEITGLYLFVLPHAAKWRANRSHLGGNAHAQP